MLIAWVVITSWGGEVELFSNLEDALSYVHTVRERRGWGWCDFHQQDDGTISFQGHGVNDETIAVYRRLVR